MANRKFEVGDVIHLNYEALRRLPLYFNCHKYLFQHKTWVVLRAASRTTVHIRPIGASHIAMTPYLVLESEENEYAFDPFLTAAYKAQGKSVVK